MLFCGRDDRNVRKFDPTLDWYGRWKIGLAQQIGGHILRNVDDGCARMAASGEYPW